MLPQKHRPRPHFVQRYTFTLPFQSLTRSSKMELGISAAGRGPVCHISFLLLGRTDSSKRPFSRRRE